MMKATVWTALLMAVTTQGPLAAQLPPPVASPPSTAQVIAQSSSIGRLLYDYDVAAWVSSDALTAKVPKEQLTGEGGYVIERTAPDTLHATYYRKAGGDGQAFFDADVKQGKVVRADLLPAPVPLTARQAALARARDVAAKTAVERGYKPCTPAPFNTVVLPLDGGSAAVYLLTAQQDAKVYPIGGNYRIVVGPDGAVISARAYNVSCIDADMRKMVSAGSKPASMVLNHLLDPVPTEIHVFTSYRMRMSLFILTPDRQIWSVAGARIVPAGKVGDDPKR